MIQNKNQINYLDANNIYGYAMSNFLLRSKFKWFDPKDSDLNKYNSSSSNCFVLEVDSACPKELCELQNDNTLATHKIEIKRAVV